MAYLNWDTKIITDLSQKNVAEAYEAGYVLTRVGRGIMNKSRSFRVKLADFEMSSENRRISRKNEHLSLSLHTLPYTDYSWDIGKLAKDFYENRDAIFTPNKIKEILTSPEKSNFDALLVYTDIRTHKAVGYAICRADGNTFHYSYPFYISDDTEPSRGLGMMILAIEYAQKHDYPYIYLGSLQRPSDTYKLQFKGGQWFNGESWQTDISPLREILK